MSTAGQLEIDRVYQRFRELLEIAQTRSQRRTVRMARSRLTAQLYQRGWSLGELAGMARATRGQVRHWRDRGSTLEAMGLDLPAPSRELTEGQSLRGRLTIPALSDLLSVDQATLRRWIKAGHLAASRAGDTRQGRYLVDAAELVAHGVTGQLVTVEAVAASYQVRPATVRRWIAAGWLAAVQLQPGGCLRLPAHALNQLQSGS